MAKMRMNYWFQHTAARRRLADGFCVLYAGYKVSTHSRPKAAGNSRPMALIRFDSFNTQPPEGGWVATNGALKWIKRFNTQPPEGGWCL